LPIGDQALIKLSEANLKTLYEEALKTVRLKNITHTLKEPNLKSDPKLKESDLIQIVRDEAMKGKIRFGSDHAAVYHMKKHPMPDEASYVRNANSLTAKSSILSTHLRKFRGVMSK